MMNITTIRTIFPSTYFPYPFITIPNENFMYNSCIPIFIPQSDISQLINNQNISNDQHEQFQSKTFNSIVLTNQDLSENKETFDFHDQSNNSNFANFKNSYISQRKRNRNIMRQQPKLVICEAIKSKNSRQKQSRNMFSNLLRIFLRNVLDNGTYEELIIKIIKRHNFTLNSNDFYRWLYSFNINFKNYVRFRQLTKIFISKHTIEYQKILLLLFEDFFNNDCTSHCLTSRKITGSGRKMHLQGARLLRKQIYGLAMKKFEA